ncbi:hypothetical protein E4T44_04516 [Aureobasidium sp. EXF-8845]|nr:hypothetical protein E4T44_04516 [Aureobasidium sp. EXF-8845]KAI4855844.1 hypothetical protein E4T45_02708 [Aureobasidium sp. EXF-8846]
MAPKFDLMPFGSTEAKIRTAGDRKWPIRSNLIRFKRPDKVNFNLYEPALKDHGEAAQISAANPPASPFDCADAGPYSVTDECSVCMPQYFPASHTFTDEQARAVLKSTVDTIKNDLAFLRDSVARHADFLVSRWKKKSREKRSTFLKTHTQLFEKRWGAVHLLDRVGPLERTYTGPQKIPKVRTIRTPEGGYAITLELHTEQSLSDANLRDETLASYRDSWFLPYLDVETLSEDPTLLLSMLHHRSSSEPEKWLTFDNANIVFVGHFSIMSSTFNRNCVVMQGPDYGKLVPWNAEQAHRWEIVGFTKAHVLLVAQRTMYNLLSKCVKGLLTESTIPPELRLNHKWDSMIASDFSRFKADFPWSTDFVKPFSAPQRFDAREISDLITSRHRVVLDELELLQTDPQYIQSLVKELRACLFFETWRVKDLMPWLVDYIFAETMYREEYWRQLAAESEQMMRFSDIFRKHPFVQTKQDFDRAVFIVQDLCIETFAVFEPQVRAGLVIQRGFERNFEFEGNASVESTNRSFSMKDCFPNDLLHWSMSTLGYDEHRPFTMDPWFNFAIIDHLCRNDSKEAARVSQTMLDRISDMSILSEMISSIRQDMTRNRSVDTQVAEVFANHTTSPQDWIKKINAGHGKALGDLLGPDLQQLCQEFPWPRGKQDLKWLKEATAARACLDKFWARFRDLWTNKLKEAKVSQRLIDEDIQVLSATSTARYQQEMKCEEQDIQAKVNAQHDKSNYAAPSEVQKVWGKENESQHELDVRSRLKIAHSTESVHASETSVIIKDLVKPENLPVFHHMFPIRGAESQRSFSWQQFLGAMVDTGFTIVQSQGSAVTLKLENHTDRGVNAIVLHRPHPRPIVNPVMLKRIAKRMQKWFGWQRETFVEKQK